MAILVFYFPLIRIPETDSTDSADSVITRCEALISAHPELFGTERSAVQAASADLRKELNDLAMQLCTFPGDYSLLLHKLSLGIRRLDASLGESFIDMKNKVLFEELYDLEFKIRGKRAKLQTILAMETEYSDSGTERLRKTYRLLHLIFSQTSGRRKVDLGGHFGWMYLNLHQDALRLMDRGHAIGRVWDASEMDASARIHAQKQELVSGSDSSATLIWNANGAHYFESEPPFLNDLSPAVVQAALNQVISGLRELVKRKRARFVSSLNHHLS